MMQVGMTIMTLSSEQQIKYQIKNMGRSHNQWSNTDQRGRSSDNAK